MLPPATWYPDPSGRHEHRYWDGERWTEHVADAGIAAVDPLPEVTADEQVDGGVAADIAAVALAATSTMPAADHDVDREDDGDATPADRPRRRRGDRDVDEDGEPDPWRVAASEAFVMPPDAVSSIRDQLRRDEQEAGFRGLEPGGGGLADAHGIVVGDHSVTIGLSLSQGGVLAGSTAIRRLVGTVDLDDTPFAWLRRLSGEGSVTLVGHALPTVVAPRGAASAVVRVGAVLAVDGAADVRVVSAPLDVVEVAAAAWMVVDADAPLSEVRVRGRGERVPTDRIVAWTGAVTVEDGPRGTTLVTGDGALLLA